MCCDDPIPIPLANITFDPNAAAQNIEHFNTNVDYVAGDSLARRIFADSQQNRSEGMVVAINSLMKTNVTQRDQFLIAQQARDHWVEIFGGLERLPVDALEHNPREVCRAAEPILSILVEVHGRDRRNYSFATKFLHWGSRGRLPIIDTKARKFIRALQQHPPGDVNEESLIAHNWESTGFQEDYKRWVNFYSRLMEGLPLQVKECLIETDWQVQHDNFPELALRNSLVRVLDKYFWIGGMEADNNEEQNIA